MNAIMPMDMPQFTHTADMPVVNPVAALPMVAAPAIISANRSGTIMYHARFPCAVRNWRDDTFPRAATTAPIPTVRTMYRTSMARGMFMRPPLQEARFATPRRRRGSRWVAAAARRGEAGGPARSRWRGETPQTACSTQAHGHPQRDAAHHGHDGDDGVLVRGLLELLDGDVLVAGNAQRDQQELVHGDIEPDVA